MEIGNDPIALQVEKDIRSEPRLNQLEGSEFNAVFKLLYDKYKSVADTSPKVKQEEKDDIKKATTDLMKNLAMILPLVEEMVEYNLAPLCLIAFSVEEKKVNGRFITIADSFDEVVLELCKNLVNEKNSSPSDAVDFLEAIRDYERENHQPIYLDERTSEDLYEIFKTKSSV